VKRFMREAKIMAEHSHPNVVAVRDLVQADGFLFLIMELVRGRDLSQIIFAEGELPADRIVRIGTQMCDALEAIHERGIIHRDLKPANVMILANSRDIVKLLDFGLARPLTRSERPPTTDPAHLVGTPAYMAPELIEWHTIDARSDLYSFGCVLYELATGHLPFPGVTAHEQLAHRISSTPTPMVDVPRSLASVIERLLERSPADRYQSAADARLALEMSLRETRGGFGRTLIGVGGSGDGDASTEPGFPADLARSSDPNLWRPHSDLGLCLTPRATTPEPFMLDSTTVRSQIAEDGSIEPTRELRPRPKVVRIVRVPTDSIEPLPPPPPPPPVPIPEPRRIRRFAVAVPILLAVALLLLAFLAFR